MKKTRGFTIFELMVTVAIGAVLVTVGIPSFKPMIQKSRITTATNELVSALHVARNEAIKTRTVTCVCSSTVDPAKLACDSLNNWESGWIVFTESGAVCDYTDGVDRLIKTQKGSEFGNQITIRGKDISITAVNYVRFTSRGAPQRSNGAIQQGVFSICDDRGLEATGLNNESVARAVQLSAAGSVRSSKKIPVIQSCP